MSASDTSDAKDVKKDKKIRKARKRKKTYTGKIVSCWKVDLRYLMHRPRNKYGHDLYLCVTDKYRVLMLDKPVVPFTGYVPDSNVAELPINYANQPFRRVCRLPAPGAVLNSKDFLSWVRTPCFIYYPCTCYCTHHRTIHSFGYPCPSNACSNTEVCEESACFSSGEVKCTAVPLWTSVVRLMYTKINNVYTFRYIVTIGSTTCYVSPLPPPRSLVHLLEHAVFKGMIDRNIYRYILDKYRNRVPNLYDLLRGGIYIDHRYVFPDGVPPSIRMDSKYIFVEFKPLVVGFNYYLINRKTAHAVLFAWLDSNAKAYAVAKAAWDIKREIYNLLLKTFRPDLVRKVEEFFINDVPVFEFDQIYSELDEEEFFNDFNGL
ncbi:MAG: hypothetical protein QXE70_10785 [Ignisphaera sp.]